MLPFLSNWQDQLYFPKCGINGLTVFGYFGYVLLQKSNRILHYTINVIKTQFLYDYVLTSGIGHSEFTPDEHENRLLELQ